MNNLHKKRIYFIIFIAIILSLATSLILYSLKKNINVFLTPSDIAQKKIAMDYYFRLGGMVKSGSLQHSKQSLHTEFIVTDFQHDVTVHFNGILPDLFREGKGVIAEGSLNSEKIFVASLVLAKHDENYMPKEVYIKMRQQQ